ncbi:unnamed protein product [Caenorhabditis brenneri]
MFNSCFQYNPMSHLNALQQLMVHQQGPVLQHQYALLEAQMPPRPQQNGMPPLQRMLQLLQQQQMMIHQETVEQQMLKQQNRHRLEQTRQHQQQQQQRILGLGRGCAARDARGGRESNQPPNRSRSRSPQGALQLLLEWICVAKSSKFT